jgi:hypothetical protein
MVTGHPSRNPDNPFAGKIDEQILAMARAAFRRAESLPARSAARRREFAFFDRCMGELLRRAMSHVLYRIHEMETAGEAGIPDGELAETIVELIERNGSGTATDPRNALGPAGEQGE